MSSVRLAQMLRRARLEREISQRELASRAGISQAIVSYYETGRASPSPEVLLRLKEVLELPEAELKRIESDATENRAPTPNIEAELPRALFLRTVEAVRWRAAIVDRPAGPDGGDLCFSVDLHSHAFLIVVDAQGSGEAAAPLGRIAAACTFGATVLPGGGVPAPEDIVDALVRFWRHVGETPDRAGACVVRLDRRERVLRQCRLNMPPPFLRSGRVAHWTGKPDGPAGSFVGTQGVEHEALLLVATDGVASAPTRGERSLWASPELRTMMTRAEHPREVAAMIERSLGEDSSVGRRDDRLAVAVMP